MTSWQSGEVMANGIRLHYLRSGGSGPPLVLAHGFSDDSGCWMPVAEQLTAGYDALIFDARGHGRSEGPERGYGTLDMADDLAGAMTALGLKRPAVLGHSMGAAMALALAGKYPDLPGMILLEDPPSVWLPPPPAETAQADRWAQMRARIVELKRTTREEMIAGERANSPDWPEAEFGPWADSKLRLSLHVLNRADATQPDWPALLPQIRCPALLITADPARGAIVTAAAADALRALVPQMTVAHIPDAGHSIRRNQPERYIEVVRGFLAEHRA